MPAFPQEQRHLVGAFTFLWFFSQLPVFILGVLLYHLMTRFPQDERRTANWLLLAAGLLLAAFLTVQTFADLLPWHVLYGFAFVLLRLALHYSPHPLLVNKATVLIGRISFSIYLVHFLVLDRLRDRFAQGFPLQGSAGFAAAFLLVLVLSSVVAAVTYRLIEVPSIRLGKLLVEKFQR
jgi:peptidoglycan/LPS O-acetylase OafA/YrhL